MIYLDHAATTPLAPEVLAAMEPYLREQFGNASALYSLGRKSRLAVENARELAAAFFGCQPQEILFTSGGSESDNLALRGVMAACRERGDHLITTLIEHHAVLHTAQALERQGYRVTYLRPDRQGRVDVEQVRGAITERTVLISVMHANNEIGTVQPVEAIGRLARERGILFHTDAVQAVGQLPTRVREMPCDLLSMSAHKIYGPKGVGLLYARTGVRLVPHITGGDQEYNRRAGTENVAGIVGLGAALELAFAVLQSDELARQQALRDRLIADVRERLPDAELTGHPALRLPNHASFRFPHIEGEPLLLNLDMQGICASSGSACAAGTIEPSHVLLAIGYTLSEAHGALRLTLGRENTEAEVDRVIEVLPPLVESLRKLRVPPGDAECGARRAPRIAE
ncbi:MAG: IscS subfamily cysteine desulfurase [Armatimonadetes bacterium]|nr:IscS subfamily cysteine desulfurase [Armatimonadota bacterium]